MEQLSWLTRKDLPRIKIFEEEERTSLSSGKLHLQKRSARVWSACHANVLWRQKALKTSFLQKTKSQSYKTFFPFVTGFATG